MATLNDILKAGFDVVGGQIDKDGKNYGFLTAEGPVLNEEGEALMSAGTRRRRREAVEVAAEVNAEAAAGEPAAE